MHEFLHTLSVRRFALEQAPTIAGSLLIAELFYKFHSFTLECLAFLATWYALDAVRLSITQIFRRGTTSRDRDSAS